VRVDVRDALASMWAGIEDDAVTVRSNALGQGDLMGVGNHVTQEAVWGGHERS